MSGQSRGRLRWGLLASIDVRWAALGAGAALAVGAALGVLVVSVAGGESAGSAGTAASEPPVTAVAPTSTKPPSAGELVAGITVEAEVTASDERWCDALYPTEPCPLHAREYGYPVSFGIVLEIDIAHWSRPIRNSRGRPYNGRYA